MQNKLISEACFRSRKKLKVSDSLDLHSKDGFDYELHKDGKQVGTLVLYHSKNELMLDSIGWNGDVCHKGLGEEIIRFLLQMTKKLGRETLRISTTSNYGFLCLLYSKFSNPKKFKMYSRYEQGNFDWTPQGMLQKLARILISKDGSSESDQFINFWKQENGTWLADEKYRNLVLEVKPDNRLVLGRKTSEGGGY